MIFERVTEPAAIETVSCLAREIWYEHYNRIIGEAQVEYMLRQFQSETAIESQVQQGYEYYLILDGDRPIGYLGFLPNHPEGELFLSKLYVALSHRNSGVGREAIEFVACRANELGMHAIWLTTNRQNRAAIEAYKRWGFSQTESVVQDIGGGFVMDDYRFRKTI